MNRTKGQVTIRPCRKPGDYAACVELQRHAWGPARREVYPSRLFIVIDHMGGRVLGAFAPGGRMVGFVASMPAWRGALRYYHSLAMGVAPEFQNCGVGQALKWEQRRHALREGIECIEWTFDPLQPRNAFLNIVKLGAIARRYERDFFGPAGDAELPTDRLVCEWWLKSSRVRRAARGIAPALPDHAALVALPPGAEQRTGETKKARKAQAAIRRKLTAYFRRGYAVTGFSRCSGYALEEWRPES